MDDSNTLPRPAMSRQQYEAELQALKQRHPWLEPHSLQPAPGHIDIVEEFVEALEHMLTPTELGRIRFLRATENVGVLYIFGMFYRLPQVKREAVEDAKSRAQWRSKLQCAACGAGPAPGFTIDLGQCQNHPRELGLFDEDFPPANAPPPREEALREPASAASPTPFRYEDAPSVRIFQDDELRRLDSLIKQKTKDQADRLDGIAKRIQAAGGASRSLAALADPPNDLLREFSETFPNFSDLYDFLADHLALLALGGGQLELPPILIVGEPGIGKTEVALWLANRFKTGYRKCDMSTMQTASPLVGSESFWSNTQEGLVFELIAYGTTANPVIVLDEVDKTSDGGTRYPGAGSALYSLLEKSTAKQFRDLSVRELSLDASHINWVATANYEDGVTPPIRSRFTTFRIQPPTPVQCRSIARAIYRRIREENAWGSQFPEELTRDAAEKLTGYPPRTLRLVLTRAFGAAARDGRREIRPMDIRPVSVDTRRPMGFVA